MANINWNLGLRQIEFTVPSAPSAHTGRVVVRCEGSFVKQVDLLKGGGVVATWVTCPPMPGPAPPPVHIPADTDIVQQGLASGDYIIRVTGEDRDCPPTGHYMQLDCLQQTDLTNPIPPGMTGVEGKHLHFQIMVGETVHITVIIEPGASGRDTSSDPSRGRGKGSGKPRK